MRLFVPPRWETAIPLIMGRLLREIDKIEQSALTQRGKRREAARRFERGSLDCFGALR